MFNLLFGVSWKSPLSIRSIQNKICCKYNGWAGDSLGWIQEQMKVCLQQRNLQKPQKAGKDTRSPVWKRLPTITVGSHTSSYKPLVNHQQRRVMGNTCWHCLKNEFKADLIVDKKIIIKLKSVEQIKPVHKNQLMTYLKMLIQNPWNFETLKLFIFSPYNLKSNFLSHLIDQHFLSFLIASQNN